MTANLLTAPDVAAIADRGTFLPDFVQFRTLDGSDVAAWLIRLGFKVTGHRDTGRNGEARTDCGIVLSTNGYCHRA